MPALEKKLCAEWLMNMPKVKKLMWQNQDSEKSGSRAFTVKLHTLLTAPLSSQTRTPTTKASKMGCEE